VDQADGSGKKEAAVCDGRSAKAHVPDYMNQVMDVLERPPAWVAKGSPYSVAIDDRSLGPVRRQPRGTQSADGRSRHTYVASSCARSPARFQDAEGMDERRGWDILGSIPSAPWWGYQGSRQRAPTCERRDGLSVRGIHGTVWFIRDRSGCGRDPIA
jgi:hypothetical protein